MLRRAMAVTLNSFKEWKSDVRVWILYICIFIFLWNDFSSINIFTNMIGIQANSLIFPFYSSDVVKQLIILAGIVFLYADIPFVDARYSYIIIRSKRISWVCGKIGYIIVSSGIYFAVIMCGSVLMSLTYADICFENWGKVIHTLAATNAGSMVDLQFAISQKLVDNYSPISAFLLTFLLNWCVGAFLGLIMFLISMRYNRMMGLLVGAIILFWDLLVINTLPYSFYYISPVTLSRLGVLDPLGVTSFPNISYAFIFLGCSIVIISILLIQSMRKKID